MTEKERKIVEKSDRRNKYNYIFKKEMVKYFRKKGYNVTEENFAFRDMGCKSPIICQFGPVGIYSNSYPQTCRIAFNLYKSHIFQEWLTNDLTLLKTLKLHKNDEVKKHRCLRKRQTKTFKKFVKKVEKYCETYDTNFCYIE